MHRVGSYERTHYGVSAIEGAQYGLILPLAFRLVVREDHYGAPGIFPALFADIVRRIEHAPRNIGSAVESFLTEHVFQFLLNDVQIVAEWHAQPGLPVKYHHRDPVPFSKNLQGLVSRIRQAFDVWLHTPAHVKKQENVDGHILALEIANRHLLTVFEQHKIVDLQAGDYTIRAINHLSINTDQGHIAAKNDVRVIGSSGWDPQCGQND